MQHFTLDDLRGMSRFYRANLINSISGFKPANLVGTVSGMGQTNLAIFSSVVHLGADPALLAFVQRPLFENGHTYYNLRETGYYTINHVPQGMAAQAHQSSAKYPETVSEFEACGFTPEWLADFPAPFVAESPIKIGMRYVQEMPIVLNNTILVIGAVEHVFIDEKGLLSDGNADLAALGSTAVAGLETYYRAEKMAAFPYAKVP
jgi:flavin reductase (DIM6/NTAB) family NADH-FMN oxidoreductase RutF